MARVLERGTGASSGAATAQPGDAELQFCSRVCSRCHSRHRHRVTTKAPNTPTGLGLPRIHTLPVTKRFPGTVRRSPGLFFLGNHCNTIASSAGAWLGSADMWPTPTALPLPPLPVVCLFPSTFMGQLESRELMSVSMAPGGSQALTAGTLHRDRDGDGDGDMGMGWPGGGSGSCVGRPGVSVCGPGSATVEWRVNCLPKVGL